MSVEHLFIFKEDGGEVRSPWCQTLDEVHEWAKAQGLIGNGKGERIFNQVHCETQSIWGGELMKDGERTKFSGYPFRGLVVHEMEERAGGKVRVFRSYEKWSDAVFSGENNCAFVSRGTRDVRVFREQKEGVTNEKAV